MQTPTNMQYLFLIKYTFIDLGKILIQLVPLVNLGEFCRLEYFCSRSLISQCELRYAFFFSFIRWSRTLYSRFSRLCLPRKVYLRKVSSLLINQKQVFFNISLLLWIKFIFILLLKYFLFKYAMFQKKS